ncbi:MAG: asparagine synthase-related protein [bacterium]
MERLYTFTAGFSEGSEDADYSEKLADELGAVHKIVEYNLEDMLKVLPEVIYTLESYDYALVRSAIPNYIVVREASRSVNALLSGEGGDELFAGYSYLKTMRDNLDNELRTLLYGAHNTAFQRDDRMFFVHSVEFRVPFMHLPLVEYAFSIPAEYKIQNGVGKYVLRMLMKKCGVPEYIVTREKRKFSDGAGSMFAIEKFVDQQITDNEFQCELVKNPHLRCKEELYYFRLFRGHYPPEWKSLIGFTNRPER